jgi:SAM-dependent methyltransferase
MPVSAIDPDVAATYADADTTDASAAAGNDITAAMRELYDSYFASADYRQRYPQANPATLAFLLRHGAQQAREIADIGCGNGRYGAALLAHSQARITGCDISAMALREFEQRLHGHPEAARVRLLHGTVEQLDAADSFDLVLMLFGVLSHVGQRHARLRALAALHQRTAPGAVLVLSVPSVWRRRPRELFLSIASRLRRSGDRDRDHVRAASDPADITFTRTIGGAPRRFFYHLYSQRGLRQELALTGWRLERCEAESMLPEWLITQHAWAARVDGWLRPWLPAALGYGILAMARRVTPSGESP